MRMLCPHGETTLGIDVSHYDSVDSWNNVKLSQSVFSFFKATEGTRIIDSTFKQGWLTAPKFGIIRGAYHFFHPSQDPIQQAKVFLSVMGPLSPSDLPPVLDFETTDGNSANHDAGAAIAFLQYVQAETGRRPIVYGSPGFLEPIVGKDNRFQAYSLWVAHFGVKCPEVPSPWLAWDFLAIQRKVPGSWTPRCDQMR